MTFYEVLTQAINDLLEHGFDSQARLEMWVKRLQDAARRQMMPEAQMLQLLRDSLGATFKRLVDQGGAVRYHPGISRFTLANIRPSLRAELDRRIMAAAGLITLNRDQSIATTLQRFAGWSTSIPTGGSDVQSRPAVKAQVRKSMARLPFEERRVIIDQNHKLISAINDIVATDQGAIAAEWHSHWRQRNYNYREDHKERDEKVYLIRHSWANDKGLVKPGSVGYLDQITQPGEEVFCRCFVTYRYGLQSLPPTMLTEKGRQALAQIRGKIAA